MKRGVTRETSRPGDGDGDGEDYDGDDCHDDDIMCADTVYDVYDGDKDEDNY